MTDRPDYQAFLQQASAVQAELAEVHQRLLEAEVTGTSGPVTVTVSASGELRDVTIGGNPPPSVDSIRRHILAAHHDAITRVRAMAEDMMRPFHDLAHQVERGGPSPR